MKKSIQKFVTILFALQLMVLSLGAQVSFLPAISLSVTNTPLNITSGDFNADGNKDIASVNYNDSVAISIGNGLGNFAPAKRFYAGQTPKSITSADFNGDGKTDLVTPNNGFSSMNSSMLLATGPGNFMAPTNFTATLGAPYEISGADFNSDGKRDIVLIHQWSDAICVMLGNGSGGMLAAGCYTFGIYLPGSQLACDDLNNDFKQDVAMTSCNMDSVAIFIGDGLGGLQPPVKFPAGNGPMGITIADLNNDGNKDLAMANYGDMLGSTVISVVLGNGAGSFSPPTFFTAGSKPFGITHADFNGDGIIDLAVSNSSSNNVSVLVGNGAGGFAAPVNFNVGSTPRTIITDDFNNDSKMDLAVPNFGGTTVSVLLNSNTTSIENVTKLNTSFKLYPNPAGTYVKIELKEKMDCDLVIINYLGQEVYEQKISPSTNEIDVSELANGIYNCLVLQNKQTIGSSKLVIE